MALKTNKPPAARETLSHYRHSGAKMNGFMPSTTLPISSVILFNKVSSAEK